MYYPSSKTCNHCGNISNNLSIREWECSKCGREIKRDLNAS